MSTSTITNPNRRNLNGGAKHTEGKPWEEDNSPGDPNRGSYGYSAAVGMTELAQDLLDKVDDEHPPALAKVTYLARVLLRSADAAQAAIRGDGWVDRMDTSHVRARGAIRSACESIPVPIGADETARNDWEIAITQRAVDLLAIAATLDTDGPDLTASAWVQSKVSGDDEDDDTKEPF